MGASVDLNADIGEGFGRWSLGDDDGLLHVISSANVACGFHAGDPTIMRRTCHVAAELGVVVGAQVSYPDLAGFGRRFIDIDPLELIDSMLYQVGALERLATVEGTAVEQAAASSGVRFVHEGFADRGYTADGRLVPRSQAGALLTEVDQVVAQALRLVDQGVRSICVHSDTPGAATLAGAVRVALVDAGHLVEPFV